MTDDLRYLPSTDQLELAAAFEASLDGLLPLARLHASPAETDETWASLDELGLFTMGAAEDVGGSGLGATEEALIVMGLGRRLASPSALATLAAVHAEGAAAPGLRTASAFRSGGRIVAIADGKAERLLVRDPDGAAIHRAADLEAAPLAEHLWLDRLNAGQTAAEPVARFDAAGVRRLRLIDAAALAGVAQAACDMAVAYAGLREQFGRPIGSFQAVKHHCANMATAARCARDLTSFAAVAVDEGRDDAALQVDCALLIAGGAALENAGKNIQVHGGIGFSDEADPHLLLKRAQLLIALAGGLEAANARVAGARAGA